MNMILHGIEAPNVLHTNTLGQNLADIQQKDRTTSSSPIRRSALGAEGGSAELPDQVG